MDEYTKAALELVQEAHRKGRTLVVETSNETMHLDPETGAMISDSFTKESFEIPPPQKPR